MTWTTPHKEAAWNEFWPTVKLKCGCVGEENITKASIGKEVCVKQLKCQFGENYSFMILVPVAACWSFLSTCHNLIFFHLYLIKRKGTSSQSQNTLPSKIQDLVYRFVGTHKVYHKSALSATQLVRALSANPPNCFLHLHQDYVNVFVDV